MFSPDARSGLKLGGLTRSSKTQPQNPRGVTSAEVFRAPGQAPLLRWPRSMLGRRKYLLLFGRFALEDPPDSADDPPQRPRALFVCKKDFPDAARAVVPALQDGELLGTLPG